MIDDFLSQLEKAFNAEGHQLWLVGGCVRDSLRGETPKDIDIATSATPITAMEIYRKGGYEFITTGLQHGTITVYDRSNDIGYEITTLRADAECDGRHARVEFVTNIEDDLARRDLTINAMAMTFSGELIDPFGGQNDLANGVIRFVGNAEERIREDYLRILRWFRFGARFGRSIADSPDLEAIRNNVAGLEGISVERIWSEMRGILSQPTAYLVISLMELAGVTKQLGLVRAPMSMAFPHAHPVLNMALLFHDPDNADALTIGEIAEKWKWSREERRCANWAAKAVVVPDYNEVVAQDDLILHGVDPNWVAGMFPVPYYVEIPPFPVNGNDVKEYLGGSEGPRIGEILARLREIWRNNACTPSRDELMAMI